MDMSLLTFEIYQDAGATNCFKSHTSSWCLHFFHGKALCDVPFEIHLVWRNIVSTGQSEEFLEVAIESWSEGDLNSRPLNSTQTLKPTELSGLRTLYRYIDIYTYIHICTYICIHTYMHSAFCISVKYTLIIQHDIIFKTLYRLFQ